MTVKMNQVLEIEPKHELVFEGPFNEVVVSTIKLVNPLNERVCFKVKTTVPKSYCVKPSSGIIEPLQELSVAVMLQPFAYDVNEKYKHKFMIQSLVVPDGVQAKIEDLWKETDPKSLMDSKLVCVLRMPGELHIEPQKELTFEKSHAVVKLHNQSSDNVAYKLEGIPPEHIIVDSGIHVLRPGSKEEINVSAKCSESETNRAKLKIKSVKVAKYDDANEQQGSEYDHLVEEPVSKSDLRKEKKPIDNSSESSQVKALRNEIMNLKKENATLRLIREVGGFKNLFGGLQKTMEPPNITKHRLEHWKEVDINLRRAALSDTCRIAPEGGRAVGRRTDIVDALTNTPTILFLFLALIAGLFLGKFVL